MDDAMILPCGYSFGAVGIQHVLRMKVCYTCSQSVSEASAAPNLSLRAAVLAFIREEELQFYRTPKRRKERFDQDKSNYGDPHIMDPSRYRGVQSPFAVADRVIIKTDTGEQEDATTFRRTRGCYNYTMLERMVWGEDIGQCSVC
ncbi:U-box domain-containing protein 62-like [Hibiscus syriacus]|uniref:U-box domain-containing protein 62-like n=1 Tax=Hibiscus syriacus TaxID=106335 RepID=UPI001920D0E0|nr:U-box domain-containing protein 62-like [Hibiscus syriacus]